MLKVSIITSCFNSADTIEDTIQSVITQDYPDIEYIIIDGASKDNTLNVVNKYKDRISKIVSEKDGGIYFGLNKGIELASGDIIGFIHSDDFYADATVISSVVKTFQESNADSVYGDLQYVAKDKTEKIIRYWRSGNYYDGIFLKGWMPPHPSFFVKTECYRKYGVFNTMFKSAADYELMLRFLHKHKITTSYLPKVLVMMRVGGKSNASLRNRIKANSEDRLAWKINGLNPGALTLILKPLSKIFQYFNKSK